MNINIHEILKQPIKTDLLEHFIQYLPMIQDWQFIRVFESKGEKEVILDYCYDRGGNNKWEKCKPEGTRCKNKCNIQIDHDIDNDSYKLKDGELKSAILDDKKKHIVCDEISFGKRHKHKALLEDIFTERYIPELDDCDKTAFKNKIVVYEYPPYTIFPDSESHKLGRFYEDQQIDLLRQLAMKYKVLRHSTKSALSAIIVRNHSHHIGSHVMPRATAEKVRERVKELVVDLEKNKLNKIVGILKDKLDEYIQKKADFTAEIATEPLTTTKSMKFIDEVVMGFATNTLLMDNIGANEGIRYRSLDDNRLKINLLRNGEKWSTLKYKPTTPTTGCCRQTNTPLEFPYSTQCFCGEELERLRNKDVEDDITIALPGCLGEFAIYAFLENFIRNGIKHNKKLIDSKKNGNFEVSVNVRNLEENSKDKDEFYRLEIWDNLTDPCKKVTVKDENGNDKQIDLYLYLKGFIDLPIVNNDGTLRKEAWGMAEMKIMATLLRGSTDFTNMSKNLTVDFKKGNKKRLVYRFYVMKPKNVAIISDKSDEEINRQNQNQNKYGIWWFKSIDELKNHVLKGSSPVSFKFLIIDKSKPGLDELKKIKPLLPFRIMITEAGDKTPNSNWYSTISKDDMCKIRNDNGEGILCITWKAWTENCLKKKEYSGLCLFLYFQQDNETEPTKSWWKAAKKSEKELINLSILSNEKDRKTSDGEDNSVIVNDPVKKKILTYDRHFWGYSYLENNQREKDIVFHEAFDKGSSDFIHIFAPYRSNEIVYELVEAALLKVLVIDERIAEVAYDELNIEDHAHRAYGGQGRLLAAKKAGVYICTHVCINNDAAPQPLHTSINDKKPIICVKFDVKNVSNSKIKADIFYCEGKKCSECKGQKIDMDAVIIHQGVLENFFKETLESNKYNTFLEALQESIPYVIVDSGRGIPAKLPDVAKFLPFSLLEDFIMKDRIAKYSLTKNIMSLTRRK